MIPINKLAKLAPRHRMRKCALVLGEVERELLVHPETGEGGAPIARFLAELAPLLAGEKDAPETVRTAAADLASAGGPRNVDREGAELVRKVDTLRHALLAATGQAPADWDLIDPSTGQLDPRSRRVLPSVKAYLEDLRSPFNVGSVFRTADAFGVEELLLSPACADPRHPRALRSAMGAVDLVAWRRLALKDLTKPDEELPLFSLELGGESLESFAFPPRGIVVLGSEELGISREARELCTYGTVSIPMSGAKGSLNVAVAFGILMYAWTSSILKKRTD
jgi:TrmH family RNA methyltransferase